jgi:hypothetical protein
MKHYRADSHICWTRQRIGELMVMDTNLLKTRSCKLFILRNFVGPPLWSSGQSSWLQIKRSGFDSRCYQIFREAVNLERGHLSLVSTIEELLGRNSSGSGLENQEYGLWIRCTDHTTSSTPKKLALTLAVLLEWQL